MALTGNKGEWSEIYALFKLLGDKDGRLYAGNASLERIENLFFPIIKILRTEVSSEVVYKTAGKLIIVSGQGKKEFQIEVEKFNEQAVKLLTKLKAKQKGSFSLPETEAFMSSVNCKTIKAKSSSKTDIKIVIHDLRTGVTPELGFSIKSQLGGNSTLLNASAHTNFIYNYAGGQLDTKAAKAFKDADKYKAKFEVLSNKGISLKYEKAESSILSTNLTLIDSCLPRILGNLLYYYYSEGVSSIPQLCKLLQERNPLKYDMTYKHEFYKYKLKKFLTEVALGMMPSKMWTGRYDATGGYLIIKDTGEILCYHIYNRNDFEDYLFENTKLDTPSTSRYNMGDIYDEGGLKKTRLNLQIRFNK